MIKLKKLNEEIKTLNGVIIQDLSGQGSLTYRKALIAVCEMYKSPTPGTGDALRSFDLGLKFQRAGDELELSLDEMNFLREIIKSSMIFFAVVIGRLIHFLDDQEKKDPGKKVEEK